MHDIFISYRRDDAAGWAGRLADELRRRLPNAEVFFDIAAIGGGEDFSSAIDRALSSSVACLVVIGPRWLDARDAQGGRRIDNPGDLVRMEVLKALRRPRVTVIPVLVGGAPLPRAEELPEELRPLIARQAGELSASRWDYDVGQLVTDLESIPGVGRRRWRMALGGAAVALAIAAAAWLALRPQTLDPARLEPGAAFRECEQCPEMIVIAPGEFAMGDDSREAAAPAHPVKIAAPLAIGRHEVTVGEFRAFVAETGHKPTPCTYFNAAKGKFVADGGADWANPGFVQGERHPAVCVGRGDALAYVGWLNGKLAKAGAAGAYRLPSEAEWEYAARAGTRGAAYWAEEAEASARLACAHANLLDEATAGTADTGARYPCRDGRTHTAPVDDAAFKPNAFGLHHMIGNAEEWVEDCWRHGYQGAPADGTARLDGDCSRGAVRGGSYRWPTGFKAGSAQRNWRQIGTAGVDSGFRVARTLAGASTR